MAVIFSAELFVKKTTSLYCKVLLKDFKKHDMILVSLTRSSEVYNYIYILSLLSITVHIVVMCYEGDRWGLIITFVVYYNFEFLQGVLHIKFNQKSWCTKIIHILFYTLTQKCSKKILSSSTSCFSKWHLGTHDLLIQFMWTHSYKN